MAEKHLLFSTTPVSRAQNREFEAASATKGSGAAEGLCDRPRTPIAKP